MEQAKRSFISVLVLEIILPVAIIAMLYLWLYTPDNTIAKLTGSISLIYSAVLFWKPQLFSSIRSYFIYPENVADDLHFKIQRISAVICMVASVFIFMNYRITTTKHLGIIAFVCSLYLIILGIVWWNNIARYTQQAAKSFMTFGMILVILLFLFSLKWITYPKPWIMKPEEFKPTLIGGVIGFLIALLIMKFGRKKIW